MTLALAHGQYSHHFRPLSSWDAEQQEQNLARSRCRCSSSSWSTCSSRVAGTGDWAYCSVGNLFYDLRAVSPGSDCATLSFSLTLPLSLTLGCICPSHAWLLIMLIFLWPAQTRGERDLDVDEWMERPTNGRTDGRGHHHILCDFSSRFFGFECVLFAFGLFVCCCLQLLLLKLTRGTHTHIHTHICRHTCTC